MTPPHRPYRFCIVGGTSWRAQLFGRLARSLPEHLELAGAACRSGTDAGAVEERLSTKAWLSAEDMVRHCRPDFVVTSVAWAANAGLVCELVDMGCHVLTETPPAPDLDGLRVLWDHVGAAQLVQVSEQYLHYPGHAARACLVRSGTIGEATSVHISSTHGYHAVSLIRGYLAAGMAPVSVRATTVSAPLVDPLTRDGWTDDPEPKAAGNVLAVLDFGGTSGLYDFTDNQWHNQLRHRRVVVRGTHGEIVDDHVIRLAGARTILQSTLVRRQLGYDLDLDGYDTDHISFDGEVLWRNPFRGARLSDEDIAVGELLVATGAWSRDLGNPPYPLAEGCQDHLVSLAIERSVRSGETVRTAHEPWAGA
ncbi:MAG TPA: Gfo/Idh/MocA family oxidoreductase [Acidimicrobiales bacterium]|nr:Gfo/Idh/MocA family oxidoreductase [Acidimicrobiales bacterium]